MKLESQILALQSYLDGDSKVCAVLEGDFINFEIMNTHDTIIIGRGENVDLDLSNELGSGRIHRRHAQISIQVIIVWFYF